MLCTEEGDELKPENYFCREREFYALRVKFYTLVLVFLPQNLKWKQGMWEGHKRSRVIHTLWGFKKNSRTCHGSRFATEISELLNCCIFLPEHSVSVVRAVNKARNCISVPQFTTSSPALVQMTEFVQHLLSHCSCWQFNISWERSKETK